MTETQEIIVDTNVVFDVLHADPNWAEWSVNQLKAYAGGLVINPVVYSELCYQAKSAEEVDAIVTAFDLRFVELPREALFLASQAFRSYRDNGGSKTSPLADFFIGAHAEAANLPILTRDEGRYKTYFPKVPLVSP